jgi:hypothetical protein
MKANKSKQDPLTVQTQDLCLKNVARRNDELAIEVGDSGQRSVSNLPVCTSMRKVKKNKHIPRWLIVLHLAPKVLRRTDIREKVVDYLHEFYKKHGVVSSTRLAVGQLPYYDETKKIVDPEKGINLHDSIGGGLCTRIIEYWHKRIGPDQFQIMMEKMTKIIQRRLDSCE